MTLEIVAIQGGRDSMHAIRAGRIENQGRRYQQGPSHHADRSRQTVIAGLQLERADELPGRPEHGRASEVPIEGQDRVGRQRPDSHEGPELARPLTCPSDRHDVRAAGVVQAGAPSTTPIRVTGRSDTRRFARGTSWRRLSTIRIPLLSRTSMPVPRTCPSTPRAEIVRVDAAMPPDSMPARASS